MGILEQFIETYWWGLTRTDSEIGGVRFGFNGVEIQ